MALRHRTFPYWSDSQTFHLMMTPVVLEGPAAGMTSEDLGVAESSTTPVGMALHQVGAGGGISGEASPGVLEAGQPPVSGG